MNSTRKLSLKRERLTELDAHQLDGVAGGLAQAAILTGTTIVIASTRGVTCACPSDAYNCPSLDIQCIDTYRNVCGDVAIRFAG